MAHLSGTRCPRGRSQQLLRSLSLSGCKGRRGPGPRGSLVQHRGGAVFVPVSLFPESLQPGWICWRSPGEHDEHLPCALPAAAERRETVKIELAALLGKTESSCLGGPAEPRGRTRGFLRGGTCRRDEADPAEKRHRP